jgi:uncharacterized membrane protein
MKKKFFGKLSDRGVQLTLLVALLSATVAIIDKKSMSFFTAGTYGFLVYLVPAIFLAFIVMKRKPKLRSLIKNNGKFVVLAAVFSVLFYYSLLMAYSLTDASPVFPITRLSTLLAVFGGVIFLRERKETLKRIIASVVIITGAVFIAGYFNI